MELRINGATREVPDDCTAAQLLDVLSLNGRRLAMEVNLEIVPRSRYACHYLQAGDQVEIVHAIGGG